MTERIRPFVVILVLTTRGRGLGLAITLRNAHASSQTPQLPDLVADPPDNVSISVSQETPTGEHGGSQIATAVQRLRAQQGPRRARLPWQTALRQPIRLNLASPPMQVFQRIYEYETTSGRPPTSEETPHREEPSSGKMEYVNADGHHHWHLQHVAAYSLWNSQKSAEVAPSQKVGFCLEDSEHVEENIGPEQGVYVDYGPHPREFCRQYQPEATEVFEGISEGWRDVYDASSGLPVGRSVKRAAGRILAARRSQS